MIDATSRKSSSSKPRIVAAGVPSRTPDATIGGRSSNGHRVAVRGQLALLEPLLRREARPLGRAQVELHEVRVGAAGEHVVAAVDQARRERVGVRAHLTLVVAERVAHRDLEAGGLRGDRVHQRAALHAREVGAVDLRRVLLAAEHEAGARPGERLVRRRGDEVAVRHRVRMQAGGDEAGEVRHVAHQQRTHLVGDLAEPVGLDRARIRGAAADDQLRPHLLRLREHLVVVDHASSRARRRSGGTRRASPRS